MTFSCRLQRLISVLCIGVLFATTPLIKTVNAVPQSPETSAIEARLRADVSELTQSPSRVPGTEGNVRAADYVLKRFQQIGLERVNAEVYNVTSPVTKNASLVINGASYKVSPFYPNGVAPSSTPKEGITGNIVYGGNGTPREFNGKKVEGSIVALEFNSGMSWITAADLGARAIIFLEPAASGSATQLPTMRGQAERKFAALPVELPRYYAAGAVASAIRSADKANAEGTVKSTVVWNSVPVRSIVGYVKGTDAELSKQTVVINAYYDSMSVVPDLAPGAEAAANCAVLLEMARYFKANPSRYSLMFVANGAHHLALAGARNFAATHFLDKDGKGSDSEKARIKAYRAFVGLDITSRTPTVGLFAKSWFYNQMTQTSENILLNQFFDFAKSMYGYAQQEASRRKVRTGEIYVDGVRGLNGRSWRSYLTSLVALDSEVATMAQKAGVSFVTANDGRVLQDTPFDLPKYLNYDNVAQQAQTIGAVLSKSLNSQSTGKFKNDFLSLPSDALSPNFGYVASRAISRDTRGGITFLPETPLPDEQLDPQKYKDVRGVGIILDRDTNYKTYSGVRGALIESARYTKKLKGGQRESQFVFIGPRVADPKGGGGTPGEVEAYSVDAAGRITVAPDQGSERTQFLPTFTTTVKFLTYRDQSLNNLETNAITKCFEARGIAFLDTLDQRYFSILKEMDVLDARTDANPMEYGYLKPGAPLNRSEMEPIAIMFSKPGSHLKMVMMQGLLGKRLVLLNTDPAGAETLAKARYQGRGVTFPALDAPSQNYTHLAYNVARDLWTLDQERISLLKEFGISNERVQILHKDAGGETKEKISAPVGGAIGAASKALEANEYDAFYRESRRAFGLESRAYPDVEATQQDVLKGILFYLALLLPFSFFLERLYPASSEIRKQIIGTSLYFLLVFGLISQVHPAFKLAPTPFIVLLAFIILALTVVVTIFLSSKFEAEIKRLKQGVHFADVTRLSATTAALGLGIANMRRRPTRTALTCVTLILLTFTVLSFTSVTASISNFARPWGTKPPAYAGMMVRQPDWSPLQERAVDSISNEFLEKFGTAPALRSWYLSFDQGETLQLRVSNDEKPELYFHTPALLGATPEEVEIGSPIPKTVIKGRWFAAGETDVALLPKSILQPPQDGAGGEATPTKHSDSVDEDDATPKDGLLLGLNEDNAIGKTIRVAGLPLTIIGIFDDSQWTPSQEGNSLRDLDDEAFTPVDYQDQANKATTTAATNAQASGIVEVRSYQHMRANALLILPYQTVVSLGGTPRSIAVGFNKNMEAGNEELQALLRRAAVGVFGATPDKENGDKLTTRLYSSVESTSYEGFASLVVPVLIAALIIANTMLGSVFERTREIGIYSSVGLAPVHVAALFIAEAMVFSVLGSISGYLVAQTVAKIITGMNLLPGITLNYSSTSAVLSTMIVMATVLLSTLYPARQASRMSQPDSDRKWQMSVPLGDLWRFQFPFTVSGQQPLGVAQFLFDFFETHTDTSLGSFYTDKPYFSSMPLRDAVALLNVLPEGVELPSAEAPAVKKDGKQAPPGPIGFKLMELDKIAADPETVVYRLSMRVWLAPFDMGVSQDVDILLMPSEDPGLYELQLRLLRQSGELSAWKRVNRQFMGDLRRQLLLWRTIKPEGQQEFILRGRATIAGETVPHEVPGAVVSASV